MPAIMYEVLYRHFHENSVGEQGNGPEISAGVFPDFDSAHAEAVRRRVPETETRMGGSFETRAWVREVHPVDTRNDQPCP